MKKSLLLSLTFLAIAASAFAQVKVATVDMAKLFDGYTKAKAAEASIQGDIEKLGSEAQRRQTEGRDLVQQLQDLQTKAGNAALSQAARDSAKKQAVALEDKLEARRIEFEKFQSTSRENLAEKESTQRIKIYGEIQAAATAVARRHGATVVLNVSEKTAAGLPAVVYSDKNYDITSEVLATLNAGTK